jgi:hypothetical protein
MTQIVRANPKFGPVLLGKVDLADGYYRIPLNPAHAVRLACLFPKSTGEEPLVAIPLVLPMGWTESPPISVPQRKPLWTSPTQHSRMHQTTRLTD